MRTPHGSSSGPVTAALTPFPLRLWGYSVDVYGRAARNHVSTDLKDVAMKASTISLMGTRGTTLAAPSPALGLG